MTPHEKELNQRFVDTFIQLNIEIVKRDLENDRLIFVRNYLSELHADWFSRLEKPITITPEVKAKLLRELANEIEENEND